MRGGMGGYPGEAALFLWNTRGWQNPELPTQMV
jgi:hypothetical protein